MHSFGPHLVLLTSNDEFRDQKTVRVASDMIHQALRSVSSEEDAQIGNNTVVSSFKTDSNFKELNEFLPVSESLVVLDKLFEVIRKDDDLLSTKTSHTEFFCTNTSKAYSFPNSGNISFSCSIVSSLVFLEHDVGLCKFLVVVDALEEDFRRKVETLFKASFSTLEDISLVGLSNEIFELIKVSLSSHGISKNDFTIN